MRRWLPVSLVLLALAAPRDARAYRTTQDETSLAAMGMTGRVAWTASPVPYWINEAGSDDIALAALTPAIDASFAAWTQPSCSGVTVQDMGTTPTRAVARDGVDVVLWEESHWEDMGFPSSLVGITFAETTLVGGAWTITGADTHLNGVDYTWVIEGGHVGSTTIDVQSIVTHEAGHFLGLLHPCEATPFDGAPMCAPLTDPASAPTMFPSYTGETERSLEADDIDGICFLYPRAGCETTRCGVGEACDGADHCVAMAIDGGSPPLTARLTAEHMKGVGVVVQPLGCAMPDRSGSRLSRSFFSSCAGANVSDSSHFVLVVNPTAGAGRAGRRLPSVEDILRAGGARFETRLTSRAGDATSIVREVLRSGASGVAVVGGDGTLHEATNGFFDERGTPIAPQAWLAPLSAGTGGDFRKTLGHDADPIAGARRLLAATPRAIDVGWLAYTGNDGRPGETAFLNIASFGLGGVVDRLVNTGPKWLGGRAAFLLAATRASLGFRPQRVRVTVDDGAPRESKILNVAIANGRFFGGGMQVAPHAALDDGLFDVVFLDETSFVASALGTPRLYRGTHLSLPHVSATRGKVVRAEPLGTEDVLLDVDGETPGRLPATFTVKPGALMLRG